MNSQIKASNSHRRFCQACVVGLSSIATLSALALVNPPQSYVLADTEVSSISETVESSSKEIPVPNVTRTIQAVDPDGNVLHQTIQQAQSDPLRKGQPAWPDYIIPRIEGYHPANNQAQEVMSEAVDAKTKDETVRVKYKKGDGEIKPGEVTSINFAWVWFDNNGQQHTVFYPNKFSPVGIDVPAPSAPKNARIVTKIPKTFHIYPGSGVTYQLRIAPDGIQPQTRTITRTIDLKLPDGTHQVKKESLTFHKDVRFNEDPAAFELTEWLPKSSWSFGEYMLPEFEGYTCGQKVVSKYELTPEILDQEGTDPELNIELSYQPVNGEKPDKTPQKDPDQPVPEKDDSSKSDKTSNDKPSSNDDSDHPKKDDQTEPKPATDNSKKKDEDSQTDKPTQTDDKSDETSNDRPLNNDDSAQTKKDAQTDDKPTTDDSKEKDEDSQTDKPNQQDQSTQTDDKSDKTSNDKPLNNDDSTQTKKDAQTDAEPTTDDSKKKDENSQTDKPNQQDQPTQTDDKSDKTSNGKPLNNDDSAQPKKDDQTEPKPTTDNSKKKDENSQTDKPDQQDQATQTDDKSHKTTDQGTQTDHSSTADDGTQTDITNKDQDRDTDNQANQPNEQINDPKQNDQIKVPDVVKPIDKPDKSKTPHPQTPEQPIPDNHQQPNTNDKKPSTEPQPTDDHKKSDSNNKSVPQPNNQSINHLSPTPVKPADTATEQSGDNTPKESKTTDANHVYNDGQKSDEGSAQNGDSETVLNGQPVAASVASGENQTLPQTGNSSSLATFVSLLATVLLGWLGLRSFKENDHQPK